MSAWIAKAIKASGVAWAGIENCRLAGAACAGPLADARSATVAVVAARPRTLRRDGMRAILERPVYLARRSMPSGVEVEVTGARSVRVRTAARPSSVTRTPENGSWAARPSAIRTGLEV